MSQRTKLAVAFAFAVAAFACASLWSSFIPLWQIPDEAAHYEYGRLLAQLGRVPRQSDEDVAIQSAMLRSMWENHYWEYLGYKRPAQPPRRFIPGGWTSGGAIPDTGIVGDAFVGVFSNLNNSQFLYYAILAPVQRAVIDWPVGDQLRALRAASHVIFALAVLFIVLTAAELFEGNLALVVATGMICLLQPMFVYIGSGLNNDNGVLLMVALLVWQVTLAWRRGFSWWRIGLIVLTAIGAVLAKRTAVFMLAWVPIVIAVWWLRRMEPRRARRVVLAGAGALVALALVAGALYLLPGTLPSNWTSVTLARPAWTDREAHGGLRAFLVQGDASGEHSISSTVKRPYGVGNGGRVMFRAWVKGNPASAGALTIRTDSGATAETPFTGSGEWQPVSVTLMLPDNASRLIFSLIGRPNSSIYADDLRAVLQTTRTIDLGVPNPSAEVATPVLAQGILEVSRVLGVYGQALRMVQDYRANLAAMPERLQRGTFLMNWTYWGRYGIFARVRNASVPTGWDTGLAILAGVAVLSVVLQLILRRAAWANRALVGLFLLGFVLLLLQTYAPLLSYAAEQTWLPQGRYLFGGMALIATLLACGWVGLLRGRWQWAGVAILVIILGVVSVAAMQAVTGFYAL